MAYSMAKTETYIRKIFGLRILKIDPGRYLAIDEEGEYVISTKSQPIRGAPYGEGLRTPLVLGGAPPPPPGNPKYRVFVIDAGETFDFVVIGTLAVHDSWIWVAGDTIRHEDEECKNSKFVSKLLVSKFPKENPQKMSANQIRVEVKKQTFNKMFADIGIEAPKTDNDNAQVRFDKMFADIGMEQIFLKLFDGIGIADQVESLDEVQAVDRAEVTIGKSDIRISSIADELKASYEDLEEWKATMKEREASFNLIMGKSSLADELEAQKEDEKWAEQTVDRAIDIEEIIADMEAYQRLGKSGIADEVEAQKEEEEWEELQAVERAKVEGISANMSIDRKRAVSEEAPDIDIDNKKQKLHAERKKSKLAHLHS